MKFNLTRFINLIKRDFITHKRSILFICLGLWAFLLAIIGFNYFFEFSTKAYQYSYFWTPIILAGLFIGCMIFTALIFKEFKTPAGRLQFLSLPASNFEKVFSRWIYTLILMPLFFLGSIYLFSSFCLADGQSLLDDFSREDIKYFPFAFIILHASTFLLTLFFNKLVPLKVMVSSIILNIVTGLICFGMFYLIFNSYFTDGLKQGVSVDVTLRGDAKNFLEYSLMPKFKFVLLYLLAPYLWVVSYFKMKEKVYK